MSHQFLFDEAAAQTAPPGPLHASSSFGVINASSIYYFPSTKSLSGLVSLFFFIHCITAIPAVRRLKLNVIGSLKLCCHVCTHSFAGLRTATLHSNGVVF